MFTARSRRALTRRMSWFSRGGGGNSPWQSCRCSSRNMTGTLVFIIALAAFILYEVLFQMPGVRGIRDAYI